MKKMTSLVSKGFQPAKCKTQLRLGTSRIKLLRNKKGIQIAAGRREVAEFLRNGQESSAQLRVEHIIREQSLIEAYDLLYVYAERISTQLSVIDSQKTCPQDLKEDISTLLYASSRCAELPDFALIRPMFLAKYGKDFVSAVEELRPGCGVNGSVVQKLSMSRASGEAKLKVMKEIASEHKVEWDPTPFEKEIREIPDDLLDGPTKFMSALTIDDFPSVPSQKPTLGTHLSEPNSYTNSNSGRFMEDKVEPTNSPPRVDDFQTGSQRAKSGPPSRKPPGREQDPSFDDRPTDMDPGGRQTRRRESDIFPAPPPQARYQDEESRRKSIGVPREKNGRAHTTSIAGTDESLPHVYTKHTRRESQGAEIDDFDSSHRSDRRQSQKFDQYAGKGQAQGVNDGLSPHSNVSRPARISQDESNHISDEDEQVFVKTRPGIDRGRRNQTRQDTPSREGSGKGTAQYEDQELHGHEHRTHSREGSGKARAQYEDQELHGHEHRTNSREGSGKARAQYEDQEPHGHEHRTHNREGSGKARAQYEDQEPHGHEHRTHNREGSGKARAQYEDQELHGHEHRRTHSREGSGKARAHYEDQEPHGHEHRSAHSREGSGKGRMHNSHEVLVEEGSYGRVSGGGKEGKHYAGKYRTPDDSDEDTLKHVDEDVHISDWDSDLFRNSVTTRRPPDDYSAHVGFGDDLMKKKGTLVDGTLRNSNNVAVRQKDNEKYIPGATHYDSSEYEDNPRGAARKPESRHGNSEVRNARNSDRSSDSGEDGSRQSTRRTSRFSSVEERRRDALDDAGSSRNKRHGREDPDSLKTARNSRFHNDQVDLENDHFTSSVTESRTSLPGGSVGDKYRGKRAGDDYDDTVRSSGRRATIGPTEIRAARVRDALDDVGPPRGKGHGREDPDSLKTARNSRFHDDHVDLDNDHFTSSGTESRMSLPGRSVGDKYQGNRAGDDYDDTVRSSGRRATIGPTEIRAARVRDAEEHPRSRYVEDEKHLDTRRQFAPLPKDDISERRESPRYHQRDTRRQSAPLPKDDIPERRESPSYHQRDTRRQSLPLPKDDIPERRESPSYHQRDTRRQSAPLPKDDISERRESPNYHQRVNDQQRKPDIAPRFDIDKPPPRFVKVGKTLDDGEKPPRFVNSPRNAPRNDEPVQSKSRPPPNLKSVKTDPDLPKTPKTTRPEHRKSQSASAPAPDDEPPSKPVFMKPTDLDVLLQMFGKKK